MSKVELGRVLQQPATIVDYYKSALNGIVPFLKSIDYKEDIKQTGLVFLIMSALSALLQAPGQSGFATSIGVLIGAPIGLAICGGIIVLIASFSKAELTFFEALNLSIHVSVLTFPIAVPAAFIESLSFLVGLAGMILTATALVNVWKADRNRVIISMIVLYTLFVIPVFCATMLSAMIKA